MRGSRGLPSAWGQLKAWGDVDRVQGKGLRKKGEESGEQRVGVRVKRVRETFVGSVLVTRRPAPGGHPEAQRFRPADAPPALAGDGERWYHSDGRWRNGRGGV